MGVPTKQYTGVFEEEEEILSKQFADAAIHAVKEVDLEAKEDASTMQGSNLDEAGREDTTFQSRTREEGAADTATAVQNELNEEMLAKQLAEDEVVVVQDPEFDMAARHEIKIVEEMTANQKRGEEAPARE